MDTFNLNQIQSIQWDTVAYLTDRVSTRIITSPTTSEISIGILQPIEHQVSN